MAYGCPDHNFLPTLSFVIVYVFTLIFIPLQSKFKFTDGCTAVVLNLGGTEPRKLPRAFTERFVFVK